MNIKLILFVLIGAGLVGSKLCFPIKDGHFFKATLGHGNEKYSKNIIIIPSDNLDVMAVEDGYIQADFLVDASHAIILKGHYLTTYSNLKNIKIKKGDRVKKGEIIGQLFPLNDTSNTSELELCVLKEKIFIEDTAIFERK